LIDILEIAMTDGTIGACEAGDTLQRALLREVMCFRVDVPGATETDQAALAAMRGLGLGWTARTRKELLQHVDRPGHRKTNRPNYGTNTAAGGGPVTVVAVGADQPGGTEAAGQSDHTQGGGGGRWRGGGGGGKKVAN
jgi:hypothetical protein